MLLRLPRFALVTLFFLKDPHALGRKGHPEIVGESVVNIDEVLDVVVAPRGEPLYAIWLWEHLTGGDITVAPMKTKSPPPEP